MAEAIVARKSPYAVEVKAGAVYWWCRCGRSQNQPFCDGSHKETGFTPVHFEAKKDETVYFCGCKTTNTQPLCDGSHKKL
jgi:CDGSH-type Zn-finger protein